jgi:hypothetical protein
LMILKNMATLEKPKRRFNYGNLLSEIIRFGNCHSSKR